MEIVFFGAGEIGRRACGFFDMLGIEPDYFTDNSGDLWEQECCGVKIISPEEACRQVDAVFLVTCKNDEGIREQLIHNGISPQHIYPGKDYFGMIYFLCNITDKTEEIKNPEVIWQNVLFDLAGGLVLGGVETWSLKRAEELQAKGYNTVCLTHDMIKHTIMPKKIPVVQLPYAMEGNTNIRVKLTMETICKHLPCAIVCNFPNLNLVAACLVKRMYPEKTKVIAVIHNDVTLYYEAYCKVQKYIDKCLVISSKIRQTLISEGFPRDKIHLLQWRTVLGTELDRSYSLKGQRIKIGYAGRLVLGQKRMDLLMFLAQMLRNKGCDFQLEFAGIGDYESEMRVQIQQYGLADRIHMLGLLEHAQMANFWKRQDIMVSCSDWEGHSISQVEAMAGGAVPILTDVSGVQDDVQDGYNGYVVEVGNIEEMADKIIFLERHREILAKMGMHAHETIKNRQLEEDVLERLLKE
ncbi:MAG: glycosyltransferase family 4 protein [Lachnospiraceae bacterium]|nr:glycosyltransferase family 4 protein [Lachnospiraceae bacterium]